MGTVLAVIPFDIKLRVAFDALCLGAFDTLVMMNVTRCTVLPVEIEVWLAFRAFLICA